MYIPICFAPSPHRHQVVSFASVYALVIGINLRLAMEVHSWSIVEVAGYCITLLVLFLTSLLFSYTLSPPFLPPAGRWDAYNGMLERTFGQGTFWLGLVMVLVLLLLPRFLTKVRYASSVSLTAPLGCWFFSPRVNPMAKCGHEPFAVCRPQAHIAGLSQKPPIGPNNVIAHAS